jgi:hypothetical protein
MPLVGDCFLLPVALTVKLIASGPFRKCFGCVAVKVTSRDAASL